MHAVLLNNRGSAKGYAADSIGRSVPCAGVTAEAGASTRAVRQWLAGLIAVAIACMFGCAHDGSWSPRWPFIGAAEEHGSRAVSLPQGQEALRKMGEDPSLGDGQRAAAWLRGAVTLLPPAQSVGDGSAAQEWLERASSLDPGEGGAGAVARTLLALLASLKAQGSDQGSAGGRVTECEAELERLKSEVEEVRHELETLKAIDLAPLPGDPQP
jgi:hypothetical protein